MILFLGFSPKDFIQIGMDTIHAYIHINLLISNRCGTLGAQPTIMRIFYRIILRSIYYCNIKFLYRINKVVRNITINILGHEGKKL